MKNWTGIFLATLLAPAMVIAQLGSFSDVPIEINADGETRFEGGVAIAENNVAISYGDVSIFCDYAQYNPDTRDVLLRGNIRIFRDEFVFTGDRAVYNLESKTLRAADFGGASEPFYFGAETLSSIGGGNYQVRNGLLTTHDSADPSWHFKSKSVRIYPDDRIIFSNVTLNIGDTPVFWWPYLYQSLDEDMAFSLVPGYTDVWGVYLLSAYTFPLGSDASGTFHLDLRSSRGVAVGLDTDFKIGSDPRSFSEFRTYYAEDSDTSIASNGGERPEDLVDGSRYRVTYQSRTYFTEDIYLTTDINYLSDAFFLEDFFRSEFILDPQPDNVASITKWDENYTINLIARAQINDFQPTTERLPELTADFKRQKFFGLPIYYEGETGFARLERKFDDALGIEGYSADRFDTFHQFTYPKTYFGWLSFIPRLGFRGTYYSDTLGEPEPLLDAFGNPVGITQELAGSDTRFIINAGFESSLKLSREYGPVQSRAWGLDGLRHVFQPYTNLSWVSDPGLNAQQILQFDRLIPSTQIPPIDFPQFLSLDSIDEWTIWRVGMRNRLQTMRDGAYYNWLEVDTFFDVNIDNPYDDTDFSNLNNRVRFAPLPWARLTVDSQLPVFDEGFTMVNSYIDLLVTDSFEVQLGHRLLTDNDFFDDSNLFYYGGYYQINENWGFSLQHRFEAEDSTLESQQYILHRDLTSWVASLGAIVRDNRGENEFGLLLSFTLKDFPKLNIPLNLDPQGGAE